MSSDSDNDISLQSIDLPPLSLTPASLGYLVTHIFLPVNLPHESDYSPDNDHVLGHAVSIAAHAYTTNISGSSEQAQWHRITKMLDNLQASVQAGRTDHDLVVSQLRGMQTGDTLAFIIRSKNTGIVLSRREICTLCEAFAVSPSKNTVEPHLSRSYPGSTLEMSNALFDDEDFTSRLGKLLLHSDDVGPDVTLPSPSDPHYLITLFNGVLQRLGLVPDASHSSERLTLPPAVLHSSGRVSEVSRITKRVRDHTGDAYTGRERWCRSPVWLFIRVAIQLSLDRSHGRPSYKQFILFFMCTLARHESDTTLSHNLHHLMKSTIIQRLSKLGTSVPKWLSELALETCTRIQEILDASWKQLHARRSLFENPSQDELARDTQLSLPHSNEYIRSILENNGHPSAVHTPFSPNRRRRGTIGDFLSLDGSFFDEAYSANANATMYDVEQVVEECLDDWLASISTADEACTQLELLMDRYTRKLEDRLGLHRNPCPEHESAMYLTIIDLYIAIDKLAVKEIPMLADYPPPFPTALLEQMLLRRTVSFQRFSCAFQYLSTRHSQSRPGWFAISNEFTEDSFPVRYYNQSSYLQELKARIEERYQEHVSGLRVSEGAGAHQSPLPTSPLDAKVIVFELQCPACIRIWRSAVSRIQSFLDEASSFRPFFEEKETWEPLGNIPAFMPYFVERSGPRPHVEVHLAYVSSESQNSRNLCYAVRRGERTFQKWKNHEWNDRNSKLSWRPNLGYDFGSRPDWGHCPSCECTEIYYTQPHTPNEILATQAKCPEDLSLDEFTTFAHLRSGGSLQWLNILRGLRSRTLNLRRHQVHILLSHALFHVGPFDQNTGTWIWHQEIQDSTFCNALLHELNDLFMDVAVGVMDDVLMNNIALLLTRMLASSPGEDVSWRAIALLRSVCRKTFSWVQELSYDLAMVPTSKERMNLLLRMAATCRSMFDVDPATFRKLFHWGEDVDMLISCSFFIYALRLAPGFHFGDKYLLLLLERNRRLSFAVERVLVDAILADPSDFGSDLAVAKIYASYRPGTHRSQLLQYPNAHWLTCEANSTMDQPSRTIHIDLLRGELRVDGQPIGGIPPEIRDIKVYQSILHGQGFFVVPSNLPGMDSMTLPPMSKYKLHFSLREGKIALRAQGKQMNDQLMFIPSKKLQEDLPPALSSDHVHWLNLSTKTIEIRPVGQPWTESPENWRIDCTSSRSFRAYRGRELLVDPTSRTATILSECFKCLNDIEDKYSSKSRPWAVGLRDSRNVIITASSPGVQVDIGSSSVLSLSVTLPSYGLCFLVNKQGELESCDFKDMVYDEDQCVGALFGLHNLLVLRPKTQLEVAGIPAPEALIRRRVLIPNGKVQWHLGLAYIHHYGLDDNRGISSYIVDTELGCLTGNGSLESTDLLARLHATTTWPQPDLLTQKTGAQAALCLLQSAGSGSVTGREPKEVSISGYPQIGIARTVNQNRRSWTTSASSSLDRWTARPGLAKYAAAAQRAAYLFPWDTTVPMFSASLPVQITLDHLICNRPAPDLHSRVPWLWRGSSKSSESEDIPSLDPLCSRLWVDSDNLFQQAYVAHLNICAQHTCFESCKIDEGARENLTKMLRDYYERCRFTYLNSLEILEHSLGPSHTDPHEDMVHRFGQWPPATADVLLRYLASTSTINISLRWKECLTSLALLLLDLQRSRRLLRLALDGHEEEELLNELENEGCDGWSPHEYPDWLLIQIQGNFLIRRSQAETAMELMSPRCRQNMVTQLNMGEGKSSVIIPIAAAALANGKQLVRVIVPKALTVQMLELLVARLGGLANRPIYHLPFSRTSRTLNDLQKIMLQCMKEHGILLVQPEHVVSLKLKCVEEIRDGKPITDEPRSQKVHRYLPVGSLPTNDCVAGNTLRWFSQLRSHSNKTGTTTRAVLDRQEDASSLQKWVHTHVRDILDESDEILHPRFQLVYTLGSQQHMDGYPSRWTIIQQVLRLVKKHTYSLLEQAQGSIQCHCTKPESPDSFPHIRICADGDRSKLRLLITEDVMAGQLPNFCFQHTSPELYAAIRGFISDKDILQIPDAKKSVEDYAKDSDRSHPSLWNGLLLLRGLLVSDILFFALSERRWRVDYGLATGSGRKRGRYGRPIGRATLLAVPYRAKDVPSPNTQFGHPDLTIILTCLSYYYTGLNNEQLRTCFNILLDELDDPSAEYALWTNDESVPHSHKNLDEVNIASMEQWDKVIFPLFAWNQATIDFYLSRVVFPKEAKEYPWKLSGSSWDLAEQRPNLTTGFSGTNDSRWLLPMSITQYDLNHQKGTNARVLAYLLRPENGSYMVAHWHGSEKCWVTPAFLELVVTQTPEICVLLDVGSQILDLSNREVAAVWLMIARKDVAGAIYFSEDDELMVLARNGTSSPLSSSALSQQLDRCVVYLDQAHTRGTDLKLPLGSRAAVTLGHKVTKDALVQGCMRMRKLGRGHSIMFFASPNVDRSIRVASGKTDPSTSVTTLDILCWAIRETWADIQQRAPYWAQQGMNHKARYNAWSGFCKNETTLEQLADTWLQKDMKSLEDLYEPRERTSTESEMLALDPGIRQRCKDIGVLSLPYAQMDEEQEREVQRERERQREMELPPMAKPAVHFLHPDVVSFVKSGIIPPLHSDGAFLPVFTTLQQSSAATREADVWSPFILATADFCRTIKPESTRGTLDQYLRHVQWILSGKKDRNRVLVLLSPFEADSLMPEIRASKHVHLHLYAPRTSLRMNPSDDLKLYSIPHLPSDWTPPWDLIDQLNVFSGQLYLRDNQSYLRLCRFLNVPTEKSPNGPVIRRNLFNIPGSFEEMENTFLDSPLPATMALLALRTRGKPFAHTHMGKILQGQILTERDFEGSTSAESGRSLIPSDQETRTPCDIVTRSICPAVPVSECDPVGPSKRGRSPAGTSDGGSDPLPAQKRLRVVHSDVSLGGSPSSLLNEAEDVSGLKCRPGKRGVESVEPSDTESPELVPRKRPRTG